MYLLIINKYIKNKDLKMEGRILSQEDLANFRNITQNITPEETQYVMDIRSTLDDANVDESKEKDVIFLGKLIAFEQKFRAFDLTAKINKEYKRNLNDFCWAFKQYTEDMSMIRQSIIGEIQGSSISKITLPVSNNPLEIINELKIMLQNWTSEHMEDKEYQGAVSTSEQFLAVIHKYIYKFRISKASDDNYAQQINNAPLNIPTIIRF